jgi:ribosome-associated heat shock protein Hsp15
MYPTRTAATNACRGGHVTINSNPAKAASEVRVGDRVEAKIGQRQRSLVVTRLIEKRVGAPVAVTCYEDHSPPPPDAAEAPVFQRDRGAGRPTKRDRREIDRLRGR